MNAELGRRIAFTLCALLVFRLGTYIPLPGIDFVSVRSQSGGIPSTLNMLSGGGAHRLSIFALSIFPYLIPYLMIAYGKVPFYFGGDSALIVVCVVLDISAQVRRDRLLNTGD